jgi:hypothetical protein
MLSLDENFAVAKKFARSENLKMPLCFPAKKLAALIDTEA